MNVIRVSLIDINKTNFDLGYVGEKNHTKVVINCASIFRDYPDAVATMVAKPPQGDLYPINLTKDGTTITWEVTESDIAYAGSGQYQLTFTDGTGDYAEIIKTVYGQYSIKPSLTSTGEPPEPLEDWLQEATTALETFETEIGEVNKLTTASPSDVGKALSPKTVVSGKVTEWEYVNQADPEAIAEAVDDWLDDHPEATTTVQDGAITEAKLNSTLKDDLAWHTDVDELKSAIEQSKAPVIIDTASGEIVTVPDGADGMLVEKLTVGIEPVQSGSGDPSPSNVRPISGWTGANVERTGVNVWDEEWEVGGISSSTGGNWETNDRIRSKNYVPVNQNTNYYLKSPGNVNIIFYGSDKSFISSLFYYPSDNQPFLTPANCAFVRFAEQPGYGTTYNHDISINYPSTDHDYHPGHVASTSYPFPSQAGTVYGGTLTVNKDGTGTLTLDRIGKVFRGTDVYTTVSNTAIVSFGMSDKLRSSYTAGGELQAKMINSHFKLDTGHGVWGVVEENCFIIAGDYFWGTPFTGTTAEYQTYLEAQYSAGTPVSCIAVLQTPITYNLTDLEVIQLLKGTNNIWADTGNISIDYPADTKLYINKKFAELQALILEN